MSLNNYPLWLDYTDQFRVADWYETIINESSVNYVEEENQVYYYKPPVRKVVPTNQFWYRSKKHQIIEPTTPTSFIGADGQPLEILSHVHDKSLKLNVITLSGEIKELGQNLFLNAKNKGEFRSIYMPDSVETLGTQAFREIGYGIYFQFSNTLKTIGSKVFSGLGLTDVYLPDSVEYIGDLAFQYAGIKRLKLPANPNLQLGQQLFFDHWDLYHIIVPEGVTHTGRGMFAKSAIGGNLRSAILPSTLQIINQGLFQYCQDMQLTITPGVQVFGDYAFAQAQIKQFDIPDSVIEIGEGGFYQSGVETVTLPNSVTTVGDYSFWQCNNLQHVTFSNSMTEVGYAVLGDMPALTSVDFGTGIHTLVAYSLYVLPALQELDIPKNITTIEPCAISGMDGLTTITVDPENTVYDSRENCNAIVHTANNIIITGCKTTVIPASVTGLGESAFDTCTTLETVTIPTHITEIGPYCFYGCTGIKTFNYAGTTEQWGAMVLGDGWNEDSTITQILCNNGIINL